MNREDLRFIFEKALSRCSRLFGYELKPILSHKAEPVDILRLAIQDLMAQEKDIFFVQIGAHDGLSYDPIAPYVRQFHWRGLLVEPQPAVFAKLKEHYAEVPTLIFENVAIAEQEGTLTLYCFKNASPDDHASMLASTKQHYLKLNGDNARGELTAIEVPAVTLNTLLTRHQISRIDLLQIDTEGYDFNIIKSLDFSRIKPRIIHFENNFLNSKQKTFCANLLAAHGYSTMDLGIDTLAYLQPKDTDFEARIASSRVARV
jgi:FkbM family methyltransferase